jgi:hypothetical protein
MESWPGDFNMQSTEVQQKVAHITTILRERGLTDTEIANTLKQVDAEIYEEVIDKIIDGLEDTHYMQLDQLMREGKSASEIVEALPVNEAWFNELYSKKLEECIDIIIKAGSHPKPFI